MTDILLGAKHCAIDCFTHPLKFIYPTSKKFHTLLSSVLGQEIRTLPRNPSVLELYFSCYSKSRDMWS